MTGIRARGPSERGFTLMELMIVVVLAGIVTLGLVVFYLNSQAMWMDASTQAMAQRDATLLIETMRSKAESAGQALVSPSYDRLDLYPAGDDTPRDSFYWNSADSLVHYAGADGKDQGPVVPTHVDRFHLSLDATLPFVNLDTLRVRSTTGQVVQMSTSMALYNGTAP